VTSMSPEELAFARAFLARVEFRYAVSVPEAPHFYLVRNQLAADLQSDFDRFVALVDRYGYLSMHAGQRWRYLNVDGGRYWASPNLFGPGLNLNRAAIQGQNGQEQLGLDLGAA
jgi:hypothetical protein